MRNPPAPAVLIARCPEHGLHGERDDCHVCGGPVEQVPVVLLSSLTSMWAVATAHGDDDPVPVSKWMADEDSARAMWAALARAGADLWVEFRYVLLRQYVADHETVEGG